MIEKCQPVFLSFLLISAAAVVPVMSGALNFGTGIILDSTGTPYFLGEKAQDRFGCSCAIVGDVNGDGYDDMLVGALSNAENGTGAGQAYLFYGKASGWAKAMRARDADASFLGSPYWQAGTSVAGAGDVNGDGYDDFLIGAPNQDANGMAFLFFGNASGWKNDTPLQAANAWYYGELGTNLAGDGLAGVGDVNGDGFDDFLVGSPGNSESGSFAGKTYVIFGKASGWSDTNSLKYADASFVGENAGDYTGAMIRGAGDVNGDGYNDFLIASASNGDAHYRAGQTYLLLGKRSGWSTGVSLSNANASFLGEAAEDYSGNGLTGLGDVNGDGFDDFMIGTPSYDGAALSIGRAYLIFGKASGWAMHTDLSNADVKFTGTAQGDRWGCPLGGPGDINGDGYDDILVNGGGTTFFFLGKPSGWAKDMSKSDAAASILSFFSPQLSTGRGDIDGDGYDDFLVSDANAGDAGVGTGKAFLIFPDTNLQPKMILSLKAYSGPDFGTEIASAPLYEKVYVELAGTDGNSSRRDTAVARVSSSAGSPIGFLLRLRETNTNTGKYRGAFTIQDRTRDDGCWIKAFVGETITIRSVQDTAMYTSVLVDPPLMTILPAEDQLYAEEDLPYSQHFWAQGPPDLVWTFASNASWLKWTAYDRNVSGTPNNGHVGSFWVRLNVSFRQVCYQEHNYTLIVNNTPPRIISPNIRYCEEDAPYRNKYASSDDGQGHVSWHLETDAGGWLTINVLTGLLSGMAANEDVGNHNVSVSIDDGNGGWAYANFTLTVNNTNDAPVLNLTNLTAIEDVPFTYQMTAMDVDSRDSLHWKIDLNATDWLDIDPNNGILFGTPENDDVGVQMILVTVRDRAGAEDSGNLVMTVLNTNDPPFWVDVPKNGTIVDSAVHIFYVNASDIDVGDTLAYSLVNGPAGMICENDTGTILWRPSRNQIGSHEVIISVTDRQVAVNYTFYIEVVPKDRFPPWITSNPITKAEVGKEYKYDVKAMDNETTDLIFILDDFPDGMTINNTSGRIYWIPTSAQVGTFNVSIHISDGYNNISANWTITVPHPNRPPVIVSIGPFPPERPLRVGDTISCQYFAKDDDNDTLTWTITGAEDITYSDGNLTWRPTKPGNYTIKFNVSDGKGGFDEKSIAFTILPKKRTSSNAMDFTQIIGWIAAALLVAGICGGAYMVKRKKSNKT